MKFKSMPGPQIQAGPSARMANKSQGHVLRDQIRYAIFDGIMMGWICRNTYTYIYIHIYIYIYICTYIYIYIYTGIPDWLKMRMSIPCFAKTIDTNQFKCNFDPKNTKVYQLGLPIDWATGNRVLAGHHHMSGLFLVRPCKGITKKCGLIWYITSPLL